MQQAFIRADVAQSLDSEDIQQLANLAATYSELPEEDQRKIDEIAKNAVGFPITGVAFVEPKKTKFITPKALSKISKTSVIELNNRLQAAGLQERASRRWNLTEQGKKWGRVSYRVTDGRRTRIILWKSDVIGEI